MADVDVVELPRARGHGGDGGAARYDPRQAREEGDVGRDGYPEREQVEVRAADAGHEEPRERERAEGSAARDALTRLCGIAVRADVLRIDRRPQEQQHRVLLRVVFSVERPRGHRGGGGHLDGEAKDEARS